MKKQRFVLQHQAYYVGLECNKGVQREWREKVPNRVRARDTVGHK